MVTETTEAGAASAYVLPRAAVHAEPGARRVGEYRRAGVRSAKSGERRLRMIEEPEEYARVRRLHPRADEELLRLLRDDLENRFATASALFARQRRQRTPEETGRADWLKLLGKWDDTLSNALQLAPQKGVYASDLDTETERLYADHVAPERGAARVGAREAAE